MRKINSNINLANTLEGEFYNSHSSFMQSVDNIFANNWLIVTDTRNLNEKQNVYPFMYLNKLLPEPLLLIKNKEIKCFSNVCTHRGNILIDKPCLIKKNITCNYHGKQFDLNGNFKFMPKCEGMMNFPSKEDDLKQIPVKRWRQFLFTSLNPKIKFDHLIKDMDKRIGWMPIEKFKFREDLSKKYIVNANWALYCDNYLEGFHIPFVHEGLNSVLDFNNYDVEIFEYSNLQIGIASDNDICFNLPKESIDYGKKIAAYYFWVFPNMMFNFYPWGLSLNLVNPISINKTEVTFKSYVWDESKLNIGAGAELDKVELEDEEIVERVQIGTGSRFYKHGRFSPTMEKGVHHFHTLISNAMNFK
ncbi:MAG: choline monooxygenase [Flavobacteriales bacterium]|nr:choline monooxygenase [Flavobacteriales bacterium]|tara:strand:+ start:61516 stop:62595 length:1080 start_codon:yes stop_codon:yes gene_type:complete